MYNQHQPYWAAARWLLIAAAYSARFAASGGERSLREEKAEASQQLG